MGLTDHTSHPILIAPQVSPLPCTRGRGVGGEGAWSAQNCRVSRGILTPSPHPLSPEYRGEGDGATDRGKVAETKMVNILLGFHQPSHDQLSPFPSKIPKNRGRARLDRTLYKARHEEANADHRTQ